ncbi:hypothetical protein [Reyranella sp.]|uniref:hypothetical protein n=1 Tax=Reyranella sp. TaxID=1929291 RepID=UPI00272F3E29|nr:hypothetical protein [Reyranella sp.]MDP2376729.1 hypothetical protein [Reyranella sp.]
MSRLLALGLAGGLLLAAAPALSQGAMGPGGAPMAPQPRVAPAPAPVLTPQVPVVPQAPMAIPGPGTPAAPSPQQNKAFTIRGNEQQTITQPGGTTTNSGTTPATGGPAGIKGTTAVVAILALQANNNSGAIFDRWGNLFADSRSNTAAPNFSVVSTDRARGSVAQSNTDQRGQFKVASTPGVHEITLPAKDIEAAYLKIVEIKGDQSPEPAAMRGGFLIPAIAVIAFKVPGSTTGGGRQDFGLARAVPRGAPSMQVKLAVNTDGTVSTVDWGDGAGPQAINREGKALGGSSGTSEIVGRTLFVGEAPKKQ